MPEYPETSTSSGLPPATTRSKAASKASDFGFSPVQFLGNQQPVWRVLFAKRKLVDPTLRFPFGKTAPKIARSAGRCLISLLSRLGEQLHDDCRNRAAEHSSTSRMAVSAVVRYGQCTSSIGSDAVNGRLPVTIS